MVGSVNNEGNAKSASEHRHGAPDVPDLSTLNAACGCVGTVRRAKSALTIDRVFLCCAERFAAVLSLCWVGTERQRN